MNEPYFTAEQVRKYAKETWADGHRMETLVSEALANCLNSVARGIRKGTNDGAAQFAANEQITCLLLDYFRQRLNTLLQTEYPQHMIVRFDYDLEFRSIEYDVGYIAEWGLVGLQGLAEGY